MSYHSSSSSYSSSSSARLSSTNRRLSTSAQQVAVARPVVRAQPVVRKQAPPGYHYMPNGSLMADSEMSSTPSTQRVAPAGYHYMPNGSIMSDAAHERREQNKHSAQLALAKNSVNFYNPYEKINTSRLASKTIKNLSINTANIPELGDQRTISITGDAGAKFRLQIKNEAGKYYNFITNLFQANQTALKETIGKYEWTKSIKFPSVVAATQYDILLFAEEDTKHAEYIEYRFADGTLDVNSSLGSNSLLAQKLIYQTLNVSLEIGAFKLGDVGAFGGLTQTSTVIKIPIGKAIKKTPFQVIVKSGATKAFKLNRQPTARDMLVFGLRNITSASPIPGENIYPTATAAFTGDDVNGAITSGAIVRMDNTDLSAVIKVGDKITTPVTTDTVNGARDVSAVAVTMDSAVATKMAVGDQVTGNAALDAGRFLVASLDSTNVFSISSAVAIADGVTLSFSSKINRSLTTVTVVETSSTDTVNGARDASGVAVTMDAAVATKMAVGDIVTGNTALDAGVFTVAAIASTNVFNLSSAVAIADETILTFRTATDFTMSQAIQFRDNAPLTFFNQANHRWGIDNANGLATGMIPLSANIVDNSTVSGYAESILEAKGTVKEKLRTLQRASAVLKTVVQPTISRSASTKLLTTTQIGEVTFNKQQPLLLAGDEIKVVAKGVKNIKNLIGWDTTFSNLKASVAPVTTTTTQATSGSSTVTIASGDGIMDDVSTVSGIGITGRPLVTTLGSYSGTTATVTFNGVQTLENGIDLTFHGAGETIIISGEVEVLNSNQVDPGWNGIFYLDLGGFITATDES